MKKLSAIGHLGRIMTKPSYWTGSMRQLWLTLKKNPRQAEITPESESIILFLPGWTCDAGTYRHLTAELSKLGHTVVSPDNFPSGLGAVFWRKGLLEQAELVLAYLDSIEAKLGDRKVHIVGHSNGGLVALLTKILEQKRQVRSNIDQIITLSSPVKPADTIGHIPFLSAYYRAVKDLRTNSAVHEIFSDIDQRAVTHFVSMNDQLFAPDKQSFDQADTIDRNHGHFDYFSGSQRQIADTAAKIDSVLRMKSYNQKRRSLQSKKNDLKEINKEKVKSTVH